MRRLQKAQQGGAPFHLLLTDWQMPEIDGLELARTALSMASPPKVVLVTAFSYEEIQQEAEDIGISGFLTKPISQSQVLDCLMRLYAPSYGDTMATIQNIALPQFNRVNILLAEDNPINQQIAVELMIACGIHTDIANNGQEALALLESHPADHYQLVFMDLQMPVMDGHEATLNIRSDERYNALPIIAMTAHALQEERERCIEEGMNDHLSKPIEPQLFYRALNHYLANYRTGFRSFDEPSNQQQIPNLDDIDCQSAVQRVSGNVQFYLQLLKQYRNEQHDAVEKISKLIEIADFKEAKLHAHSLKGVSGNIGAKSVAVHASEIEQHLGREDSKAALQALQRLQPVLDNICEQIATLDTSIVTPESERIAVTPESFNKLMRLLEDNDCAALDLFPTMEAAMNSLMPAKEVESINDHLQSFDFDLAKSILERYESAVLHPESSNHPA